jgi:hypothetical protein
MKISVIILLVALAGFAQEQQEPIQDLTALVGKKVIVQRMPLCQPGTYTIVLAYAGKQASVISLKPSNVPHLSEGIMSRLTPEARTMMEDAQKAATILVQFDDGTQLDSCGPVSPSRLSNYFELAPGQTLEPIGRHPPTPRVSSSPIAPTSLAPTTDVPSNDEVKLAVSGNVTPSPIAPTSLAPSADLLSNDEVRLALNGNGRDHWVLIQDMSLGAAQGNQVPSITLYLPEAVLAIQSESAKKQFTQYVPSEEEKRRSLMIVAEGYAGKTITEGCTSITRIVLLSDPAGNVVQEAYLSEPLGETWRNGFGATNECQSLRAKFSLADVHKVKAAAPNGEFFVAVFAGSVNTKMYKVKKKHQAKLGLE